LGHPVRLKIMSDLLSRTDGCRVFQILGAETREVFLTEIDCLPESAVEVCPTNKSDAMSLQHTSNVVYFAA